MPGSGSSDKILAQKLAKCLDVLLAQVDEADADNWGADIFRRLRSAIRAVQLDLEADLYSGNGFTQATQRLGALGAELSLQEWIGVWPDTPAHTAAVIDAREAVEAFREHLRTRSTNAAAT
jgi:hypothetical protein